MDLIGFHGTTFENANRILNESFKDSDDGWLGKGVYFFQATGLTRGKSEAQDFAQRVRKIKHPKVIQARISVENKEDYIDLLSNDEDRSIFDQCKAAAIKLHVQSGFDLKRFHDGIIFHLIDKHFSPQFIRALVDGYREKLYTSFVVRRPQLIVCVKKQECIKEKMFAGE